MLKISYYERRDAEVRIGMTKPLLTFLTPSPFSTCAGANPTARRRGKNPDRNREITALG